MQEVDDLLVELENPDSGCGRRLRILFVDDEPRVLRGLERTLGSRRGEWDMAFAGCGEAALALCAADRSFDVVVSDIRMPGIDGTALLHRVRTMLPDAVRIALTGHADQDETLRGLVHGFLTKPCDPRELWALVESICAEVRA